MLIFQSTRSARSATDSLASCCRLRNISIHAPRKERDTGNTYLGKTLYISIHALRKERDQGEFLRQSVRRYFNPRAPQGARRSLTVLRCLTTVFQSTRSARSATAPFLHGCHPIRISIHALRKERDADVERGRYTPSLFQSTRSARSATTQESSRRRRRKISIHALRKERDCRPLHCGACGENFNPRAPQGARQQKWT